MRRSADFVFGIIDFGLNSAAHDTGTTVVVNGEARWSVGGDGKETGCLNATRSMTCYGQGSISVPSQGAIVLF
jgi:hypothetical protein